ncbi:MAG: hypothetical protein DMD33_16745 [Gemmatimonadetes bacterium]|nr:MAG: hypothetical protein DMD33_16745 [Gemmatimonadota bacterium]PYO71929.1 MAG: hypothetical protein DMD67_17745 [Gemmatimonadota bacterium]TLY46640.1 MAG: glycosyltransferase family 4 protein [Gemmatimonadota bacterium]
MTSGRRLLIVTYHFGNDVPPGGLRWLGITKYLARLGWNVVVITATEPAQDDSAAGVRIEYCPRLPTCLDGVQFVRRLAVGRPARPFANEAILKSPVEGGRDGSSGVRSSEYRGLLRELAREMWVWLAFPDYSRGWTLRAALRARSLIRRFRPQAVVSSGPPHTAHLAARIAIAGSRVRWLVDLRDPWSGPWPPTWRRHRIVGSRTFDALSRRLEGLAFRRADGVIANSPQLLQALVARYPAVHFACVPNGVDSESLPPPARDPYPGLGIAYTGMLYTGRDLGPVVRALRIFLERHPEAARAGSKLRVAGQAEALHAQAFSDAVTAAGMESHVEMLGVVPRTRALRVVSRSRLAVVLAQQQELQIPAKLYESVAMGVPTLVVAPAGSASAVEGKRVGAVVCDSDDVDGIACLLERLWRDGGRERSLDPLPITYEVIAARVDELLNVTIH